MTSTRKNPNLRLAQLRLLKAYGMAGQDAEKLELLAFAVVRHDVTAAALVRHGYLRPNPHLPLATPTFSITSLGKERLKVARSQAVQESVSQEADSYRYMVRSKVVVRNYAGAGSSFLTSVSKNQHDQLFVRVAGEYYPIGFNGSLPLPNHRLTVMEVEGPLFYSSTKRHELGEVWIRHSVGRREFKVVRENNALRFIPIYGTMEDFE